MENRVGYSPTWGSHMAGVSLTSLPPQAIPKKQKNKKWRERTMDALEREGIKQVRENRKYNDFFRMIQGKLSFKELSDTIPQLREVESSLQTADIPSYLKHYDIIGVIINALVGEFMTGKEKFSVTNVDEIASNEFLRDKQTLLQNYVSERIAMEVNIKLIRQGINPFADFSDFESEEEAQQYMQFVEEARKELTPPEIEETMRNSWKTIGAMWGSETLEADEERFNMDEMDREEFTSYLATGKCFREFQVGIDYYKPKTWDMRYTFYSKEPGLKYVQDGEYVGQVQLMTAGQIVSEFGHILSHKEKDKILGTKDIYSNGVLDFSSRKGGLTTLPHPNYYDYNDVLDFQSATGVPLGVFKYMDKDGEEVTVDRFFPERFNNNQGSGLRRVLYDGTEVRNDLYTVTKVYWKSYQQIYLITYETESGLVSQELFTEDLLPEIIDELDFKKLKVVSLSDAVRNPQVDTVVYDIAPEVWQGIKISGGYLTEPIYAQVEPMAYQIKGDSNIYDVKLPVAGLISDSLAAKIEPYQIAHNVTMNQAMNLLSKELGVFFLFDVNFLPSEMKGWGDTEETLLNLRELVKDIGLFPVDTSKQNLQNGSHFNQFGVQNLTLGNVIAEKLQLAEAYKAKAYEQVGFNPQRLGQPIQYTTAEGVIASQNAAFSQTEVYFDTFRKYKKRMLEQHLAVAQFAQSSDKDTTVFYTKSDQTQAFLKLNKHSDPDFPLRRLNILPVIDPKKRKDREMFKAHILQNNTLGNDELAIARVIATDTMDEIIAVAREERLKREASQQMAAQQQQAAVREQYELEDEFDAKKWERTEYSKQLDRQNRIDVERINSLGLALRNNPTEAQAKMINDAADLSLRQEELRQKDSQAQQEIEEREKENKRLDEQQMREYNLRLLEMKNKRDLKLKEMANNKYIAQINKN